MRHALCFVEWLRMCIGRCAAAGTRQEMHTCATTDEATAVAAADKAVHKECDKLSRQMGAIVST